MKRAYLSASPLATSLCLALVLTMLVTPLAPFAGRRVEAKPSEALNASTSRVKSSPALSGQEQEKDDDSIKDYSTTPPPVTKGVPGPNLPDLEALRQEQPAGPSSSAPVPSNLPCADCDAGGGGGYEPPDDQRYSTARTRPENETGQSGVDLGSRNFNWRVPILSLPGRAGLDLNLTLSYNSLVWTKQGVGIKFNADRGLPGPGFRIGFPTLHPRYMNSDSKAYAFMLLLPSGAHIEMRQVGSSYTYEAADSTYTQMEYYPWGAGAAQVRTADGTQLWFEPSVDGEMRCNTIKDRNGNFITVYYDQYGHPILAFDTLYRQLNFNYDADHNLTSITQAWSNGGHVWARFEYGSVLIQPNFTGLMVTGPNNTNQTVLTRVVLEDQSRYDFSYTNWGQVWKITRFAPDGGQLTYTSYNLPGSPLLASSAQTDCPRFTEERLWAREWNNGAEAVTSFNSEPNGAWNEIVMPDRTTSYKEFFATTGWQKGLTTRTESRSEGALKKWTTIAWTQDNTSLTYQSNPRPREINIYDDAGNHRRTVVNYTAQFGLPSDVYEYAADGWTLLRRAHTDYEFDPAYIERRIIGLPTFKYVYDGAGALAAKTAYSYDWWPSHYEATPQPAIQHDSANYGLNLIRGRGNLTSQVRFDVNDPNNAQGTATERKWGYNTTGALTFTRDPLWHQTFISYNDSYSDGVNGRNTYAYPTQMTDGDGNQSFTKYNYDFGAAVRMQGPPPAGHTTGLVQEMIYDGARRLSRVKTLANNQEYFYHRWVYLDDGVSEMEFSSVNNLNDDAYSYAGRDGLGNVRVTAQYHPGSVGGYSAQYVNRDVMNRIVGQSNPTEITVDFLPAGDDAAGWQWTLQQYNWQGRPTLTTLPGGATLENTYGGCGCAGGEQVTTRDERGRRRRLSMDVLGRLIQVEELNFDGSVYATSAYEYNARDQLTSMKQLGASEQQHRVRSFEYDGHGRLRRRTTPEQGATEYAYNADDTLESFKDARGAKIVVGYNNNRHLVNSVSYDLSGVLPGQSVAQTPTSTYQYDGAGNRTQMVTTGVSTVNYSYDQLSRLTSETVQFNGVPRSHKLTYEYNRAGELTSLTNPFDSKVSYVNDRMGRVTNVAGDGPVSESSYVNDVKYRAWGATRQIDYGNDRVLTTGFDSRLRLTQWNIEGVLGYEYSYNHFNENSGRVTFARNTTNGAIGGEAARDPSLDRSYDYDHLGRLVAAYTGTSALAHTGQGSTWGGDGPYGQSYAYDQWGNLTQRAGWGGEHASYVATFDAHNRRAGSLYDLAGNIINDGGQSFAYDATGQQVYASVANTQMSYDGDRMRVKKVEDNATTYYVRSSVLGGQPVVDVGEAGQWVRGYVYVGGQLLVYQENGRVLWVHEDPVTKGKRTTNMKGAVETVTELDPWGGETNRSEGSWLLPRKYTTYDRDVNQGDDAMHRRYNRWWSRFDQPDPWDGGYNLADPQSFNRYSYVQNDPVNFGDPTGLQPCWGAECGWGSVSAGFWGWGDLMNRPHNTGQEIIREAEERSYPFIFVHWDQWDRGTGLPFVSIFDGWSQWSGYPQDDKAYLNCVRAIKSKYNNPPAVPESEANYELDKKQLLELFALKVKQNHDKTYFQIAMAFGGAIVGGAWAGTRVGARGGIKGALIGAGVGALIATALKIGDQIFGDSQIQEEFNLRVRQLAEKYPNAAARDAYYTARDADIENSCSRFMK